MITFIGTLKFERWWRKMQAWFATQFASINVDLTPIEEKVDEVKSDVADVKTDVGETAKQGSDPTATNTAQMAVLNTIATNMYKGIPIVSQSGNATISPNMYNIWSNVSTDLVITKGNDISGIVNEYALRFTLDSTWITDTNTITFSGWQLDWNGGSVPTWTAGHTYEISIINNIALWVDIEPTV